MHPNRLHSPSKRVSQRVAFACMALLQACTLYDAELVEQVETGEPPPQAGTSGAAGAAGAALGVDAGLDAGMPDGGAGAGLGDCVPTGDALCPRRCTERCNGLDDDCDGRVDEAGNLPLCVLPHAQGVCVEGTCRVASCAGDFVNCNLLAADGCESRLDSVDNCGICGNACDIAHAAVACEDATCLAEACLPGYADCNDALMTDGCEIRIDSLENCGGCGETCGPLPNATATCEGGTCGIAACEAGYADCNGDSSDGCERPVGTLDDCGACDQACDLDHAQPSCVAGVCIPEACEAGFDDCDGAADTGCEQPLDDPAHCGACGAACSLPHVSAHQCSEGACAIEDCDIGWGDCDGVPGNGCETPLDTLSACRACDAECRYDHASGACGADGCQLGTCDAGYADCDGDPANGCEQSLADMDNCGGCDIPCAADQRCNGTSCVDLDCDVERPGYADCDVDSANGCETPVEHPDAAASYAHCGACGRSCGPVDRASVRCSDGICRIAACDAGYADCDGVVANGCETDIHTNENCGTCGGTCSIENADATCRTGTCELDVCDPGRADCNDDLQADGCETLVHTKADCGACGAACEIANASEVCVAGSCTFQACHEGWSDCNADLLTDGCETDTRTLSNCGACGSVCYLPHASETCDTGSCQRTGCDSGYGDCSSAPGCETPLDTSSDCGSCGRGCAYPNATATCNAGACEMSGCQPGFGDCNGDWSDGCEQPLNTPEDCGACGHACPSAFSCIDGECRCTSDSACGNGERCCAGQCVDVRRDEQHCGACGSVCDETCCSGRCVDTDRDEAHCGECNRGCGFFTRCCGGDCGWLC